MIDNQSLGECENELLHLSGKIQNHGALLAVDSSGVITHASSNTQEFLGSGPEQWLARALPEPLLGMVHDVMNRQTQRAIFLNGWEGVTPLDICVSRNSNGGGSVLECFPSANTAASPGFPHAMHPPNNLEELQRQIMTVTDTIGEMSGFQRVMFYRFHETGDGEVIAECCRNGVFGSYLGLRFPASDIPHIARQLYVKNPWRLIPDVTHDPVLIHGCGPEPLDLTYSDLRSVSPVHRIYLQNMGVRASLSFPVVTAGTLYALIACHHHTRRYVPLSELERMRTRIDALALAIASYVAKQRMRLIDGLTYRFNAVRALLQRYGDVAEAWPEISMWLMREFDVDGIILCMDDVHTAEGVAMESNALNILDRWFCGQHLDPVLIGDNLVRQIPDYPFSAISGTLAIRFHSRNGTHVRVYLNRMEQVYEVTWGGNPDKPVEFQHATLNMSPRRSFEKWVETRLGYCRPWSNESRLLLLKLRELLLKSYA